MILDSYLDYTSNTEAPATFHRWALISCISALLAKDMYIVHGHAKIYPNMYTLFLGSAGSRKSTAISIAKGLLKKTGYADFAPTKVTREKYLLDLSEKTMEEDVLDQNLFGSLDLSDSSTVTPSYIVAGEFNTFFGNNILDFVTDLGELWDYHGRFESKVKHGKSTYIDNPLINILGGTTPTQFSKTFPPEIVGQGFFSRLLMVYGERTRDRVAFPEPPSPADTAAIVEELSEIKSRAMLCGELQLTQPTKLFLEDVYMRGREIKDSRFESYNNRRFTHLLKLCIMSCAVQGKTEVDEEAALLANTYLTYLEQLMPKAMGEFGKNRNADVVQRVLQLFESTARPLTAVDVWKEVKRDLERQSDLTSILNNLLTAGQVQVMGSGFIIRKEVFDPNDYAKWVDFDLLSAEELAVIGM